MHIKINPDHNMVGHQVLCTQISGVVQSSLSRFNEHITRVEVHVSDVNGSNRNQNDIRCIMEACIEGRQPVAVTYQASTLAQAIDGAAVKLTRLINNILGRQRHQRIHRTDPDLSTSEFEPDEIMKTKKV